MVATEANFDGLVGPTHHYAGLSEGNVASMTNLGIPANPRQAALEGLEKMWQLVEWGIPQGVLPPHQRPHLPTLRRLGFTGPDDAVLRRASRDPRLLSAVSSASSMWVANAATVSASADTLDARIHITPANLTSKLHRSIESVHTSAVLKRVFTGPSFVHHPPLPGWDGMSDEGAANFMRIATGPAEQGVEVFVYGRTALVAGAAPKRFGARQTRESFEAIARLHRVRNAMFLQQNPDAIDAGVFHNDVIAVSHENLVFCHELAFADPQATSYLRDIPGVQVIVVPRQRVSLQDAIDSYLFNSQILTVGNDRVLFAAQEVFENPATREYVWELEADGVFDQVVFASLRQSMRNGGGPACLRLRVAMTDAELTDVHSGVWLDQNLFERLKSWVEAHYRDRMSVEDLADPVLLNEVYTALDALTQILDLDALYEFQRDA